VTSPPIGVTALSMSAAVVPGAKFCAMTTKGPARPLMLMPGLKLLRVIDTPLCAGARGAADTGASSVLMRACATCAARRWLPRTRAAGPALGFVMREAREPEELGPRGVEGAEWRSWRSCVHSPLMLPAARMGFGGGTPRGPVEATRFEEEACSISDFACEKERAMAPAYLLHAHATS
jgi:hypothetical protein